MKQVDLEVVRCNDSHKSDLHSWLFCFVFLPVGNLDVDCVGAWSSCDDYTCTETYTITTPQNNYGQACAAYDGSIRVCDDDSGCSNTAKNKMLQNFFHYRNFG